MLTAGVSSASQTERSSVLGTVANRSSGRPLARKKSIWIAAATRRSWRNRSQIAATSSWLSAKASRTSYSDSLLGRFSTPMKRLAKDMAAAPGRKLEIYASRTACQEPARRRRARSLRQAGAGDRVNLSERYDYPFLDIVRLDQDQPCGAWPGVPPRRGRELGSHPRDRRPDLSQILVLAFGAQIPVPAGAQVDALHDGAHGDGRARARVRLPHQRRAVRGCDRGAGAGLHPRPAAGHGVTASSAREVKGRWPTRGPARADASPLRAGMRSQAPASALRRLLAPRAVLLPAIRVRRSPRAG